MCWLQICTADNEQASSSSSSSKGLPIVAILVPLLLLIIIVAVLAVRYRRRLQALKEEVAPLEFPPIDGWEFDRNQLKVGKCIGQGEFGQVFKVREWCRQASNRGLNAWNLRARLKVFARRSLSARWLSRLSSLTRHPIRFGIDSSTRRAAALTRAVFQDKRLFIEEGNLMKHLHHENVIALFGVCFQVSLACMQPRKEHL